MSEFLLGLCITLIFLIFACLGRAATASETLDRLLALNTFGIIIVALLAVSACLTETYFLDAAVVSALVSFVITISVAKDLEKGRLS